MGFRQNFKSLPGGSKRLLALGAILAFVVALPLFIWSVVNLRFDVRERAQVGPTCVPRPACLDQLPHPCLITEPAEGWCLSTISPTSTATSSATPTATATATSTPTATPTPTSAAVGGINNPTNSCGGTCGSKYNCGANLYCYQGYCRNPICPSDSNCDCVTASPSPTPKSKSTKKPTPMPTSAIVYLSPEASSPASETPTPTSSITPQVTVSDKPNLNFLLYISGASFVLALVLMIVNRLSKK